jgi:MarR family transcriptional regulator, organic hydroperoxide resistance regulator
LSTVADEEGAPSGANAGQRPLTPSQGTAHARLGAAFKRAMGAVRRLRGRETHHPEQISFAQYTLLFSLAGLCEGSARELAEQADLSPATVAQMLEGLETQGLVTRARSDQDRRVVMSSLTERGEQLVADRHVRMEPRWRAALGDFDDEELLVAARVLERLADYFDALSEAEEPAGDEQGSGPGPGIKPSSGGPPSGAPKKTSHP